MNTVAVTSIIFIAASVSAFAQTACPFGNGNYAVGSTLYQGRALFECKTSDDGQSKWVAISAEGSGANCLYADDHYGHGAVLELGITTIKCSGGLWFPVE